MRKIVSSILATVLSVSVMGVEMLPTQAASLYVTQPAAVQSDAIEVAQRSDFAGNNDRRLYIPRKRDYRNPHWDNRRPSRDRPGYWRGHRGYDHYRPGYRRHGDLWFPLAAFAAGAIISGAVNNNNVSRGDSHVRWCYNRYRSYRSSDNTFQPYNGPRQQCISPY